MEYQTEIMTQEELEHRVATMTDDEQAHFKLLVQRLVMCYGKNAAQGIVVIGNATKNVAGVITVNCDEMEAAKLMIAANDFFGFLNTIDAPPKEEFN